ncbi:His Kinase A (phospho-acceptor) domain-containing protein [Devosia sp. YR412]|uniref:GAF domain-containing sensor histidine kinase n=1 Tax=Devosia sp. YR412 TaxID=1881030 RepID=UPI0008C35D74|nr:GAF domain-containing sensor histidine kinase [Devosia sp. YR412]SEP77346.1 His Kinase A (phospho-acceptor) domain-containing protein [Devosia sp. YR412]
MSHDFQADIDAVARIDAVNTILNVVCQTTGMGFAAVARVTEDRWIALQVLDQIDFGLTPGSELELVSTICNEIRDNGRAVVIDHVAEDPTFRTHHTPLQYGFESYISVPIVRQDGSFFGTLCAIDPKPAKLNNPAVIGMFEMFAKLIASQLDSADNVSLAQAGLASERQMAELREQFIGVLGHDLRNPLAAIGSGANMLLKTPLNEKATRIVTLMQGAVVRMESLISNVMDFASGRLGSGIELNKVRDDMRPALHQVIEELRVANPERQIVARIDVETPVHADKARVAQLFSNLLANALTHGAPEQAVEVEATAGAEHFQLTVVNGGERIPEDIQAELFQPFSRPSGSIGRPGLGLGLYIASQIAEAHGGTITVNSTEQETRFTFSMPNG